MALHDFRCGVCGWVAVDVNVPISEGAVAAKVYCPHCSSNPRYRPIDEVGVRMVWIPQVGRMDASSGPGFEAFETYDGRNQKVTVTSLAQLRRIERESEQLYRNGEGQPLVFRAFSNDRSNKDQSALHKTLDGSEQPTEAAKRRYGSTLQKAAQEPDVGYGPGVSDANASALPMSGDES